MKKWMIILCIIFVVVIIEGIIFFMIKRQDNIFSNEIKPNTNTSIDNMHVNTNNKEEYIKKTMDKVTIEIKDGTLTSKGVTIIIKDNNEKPYEYTKWYRIDKNENEQWKELEPIDKNHICDELAQDQGLEFEINWTDLYGNLEKGRYRLVKKVYDSEDIYFGVEFLID